MQQVEITIKGQIDEGRSEWFEGMHIVLIKPDETVLTGQIIDQTTLFGLLTKIRDLGLVLVSVQVTENTTLISAKDV